MPVCGGLLGGWPAGAPGRTCPRRVPLAPPPPRDCRPPPPRTPCWWPLGRKEGHTYRHTGYGMKSGRIGRCRKWLLSAGHLCTELLRCAGQARAGAAGSPHRHGSAGLDSTPHRRVRPPRPLPTGAHLFPLSTDERGGGRTRVPRLMEREGRARRALPLALPLVARTPSTLLLLVLRGALERHLHDGGGGQGHLARARGVRARAMVEVMRNQHRSFCHVSGTCLGLA